MIQTDPRPPSSWVDDDDESELLEIDDTEPSSKKRIESESPSCSVKIHYNGEYIWEVGMEEFPDFIRSGESLLSHKLREAVDRGGNCNIIGPDNLMPSFESMIQYLLDDWKYRESFGGALESPLEITAPVPALLHWQVVIPGGLPTSPTFIFTSAWSFTQQRGWMALANPIPYQPTHKIMTQFPEPQEGVLKRQEPCWIPVEVFSKIQTDLWQAPMKYKIELLRSGIECLRRATEDERRGRGSGEAMDSSPRSKQLNDDKFEDAIDTRRESPFSSRQRSERRSSSSFDSIRINTNVDGDKRAISITVPYLTKRFHHARELEITYFHYMPSDVVLTNEEAKAPFYYLVLENGQRIDEADGCSKWRIQIELSPMYSVFLLPGGGLIEAPFCYNEVVADYKSFRCPSCSSPNQLAAGRPSWFRASVRGIGSLGCTSRKHLTSWMCLHEYENSVPRLNSTDLQPWFEEFGLTSALDVEKVIDYTWGYLLVLSTDAIYRSNGVCAVIIASHLDYHTVHPEPVPIYYKGMTAMASKDVAIAIVNLRRVYMLYAKVLYAADFEWGDTRVTLGGGIKFEGTPGSADSSLSSADELSLFFPHLGLRLKRR